MTSTKFPELDPERESVPTHIVGATDLIADRPPSVQRILIAAEALFAEHGYAAISVEDILVLAEVSRATFYQRFAGKEDLASALFQRALAILEGNIARRVSKQKTLNEKLSAGLDLYLSLWQRHGRLFQELTAEALRPGSKLGPMRRQLIDRVVRLITESIPTTRDPELHETLCLQLILGLEGFLIYRHPESGLTDAEKEKLKAGLLPELLAWVGRAGSSDA